MPELIAEKLERLAKKAEAIRDEYDIAMRGHSNWEPMKTDKGLHERLGNSFSSHAFGWLRDSARRDMVLALMRIWDNGRDTLSLFELIEEIDSPVMEALVARACARFDSDAAAFEPMLRQNLFNLRDSLRALIAEYGTGGASASTLDGLRILRNGHLAHNLSTKPNKKAIPSDLTDEQIDQLYLHTAAIVKVMLSLLTATAYEPLDTAKIYQRYAAFFWEGIRGEQTEGHPHMERTAATRARLAEQGFLPPKLVTPEEAT